MVIGAGVAHFLVFNRMSSKIPNHFITFIEIVLFLSFSLVVQFLSAYNYLLWHL